MTTLAKEIAEKLYRWFGLKPKEQFVNDTERIISESLAAHSAKLPEWISVKDRLPEPQQPVLFVVGPKSKDYAGTVLGGKYVNEVWGFATPGAGFDAAYWMPMPEPPVELRAALADMKEVENG